LVIHLLYTVKWRELERKLIESEGSYQLLRINNSNLTREREAVVGMHAKDTESDTEGPSKKRYREEAAAEGTAGDTSESDMDLGTKRSRREK
jgi:hypothetical protein